MDEITKSLVDLYKDAYAAPYRKYQPQELCHEAALQAVAAHVRAESAEEIDRLQNRLALVTDELEGAHEIINEHRAQLAALNTEAAL